MHVWLGNMSPRVPNPRRVGGGRRIDQAGADPDIGDVEESPDEAPGTRRPARSRRSGPGGHGREQDGACAPKPPGLW